ncbi:MAG: CDP-alcohol phosphatidyltransferase family protein [Kiritimatiellales bacterium]
MKKTTLPNEISLVRIVLSPVLLVPGLLHRPRWFLLLFGVLLVTDFLDGFLARVLHQQSRLGTQLDTAGDVLMAFFAIAGAWILWTEQLNAEAPYFTAVPVLLGLSGAACLLKFRKLPSYHAWSAKISTSCLGVGAWLLFAGITPWVFRLSLILLSVSALEGIAITLILSRWRPEIPTVFHALRGRRASSRR